MPQSQQLTLEELDSVVSNYHSHAIKQKMETQITVPAIVYMTITNFEANSS